VGLLRKQNFAWLPWTTVLGCLLLASACLNPRPEEVPSAANLDGNTSNPDAPIAEPERSVAIAPPPGANDEPATPAADPAPASPQAPMFNPSATDAAPDDAGPPAPDASPDAGS
jgi:hypothetical protein